jgi:hypothetical protein
MHAKACCAKGMAFGFETTAGVYDIFTAVLEFE